jgi:hypothetical protein
VTTIDDPAVLLEELGLPRAGDGEPAPPTAELDDVRARIHDDLERTQGPWRARSWASRLWPAATALALGGVLLFVWPAGALDGRPLVAAAAVTGTLAVLLTILAATAAPERPGLAERLSLAGLALGLLALGWEAALGLLSPTTSFTALSAVKCGGMMLALAAAPLVPLGFNLWRSRCPARPLHVAAAIAAATAAAGVAMWRHCAADERLHILLAHVALPALLVVGLGILLYTQLQPAKSEG